MRPTPSRAIDRPFKSLKKVTAPLRESEQQVTPNDTASVNRVKFRVHPLDRTRIKKPALPLREFRAHSRRSGRSALPWLSLAWKAALFYFQLREKYRGKDSPDAEGDQG